MSTRNVNTREYVIPLYPFLKSIPRSKRTPRAIRYIKEFVSKHVKVDVENVKISESLNNYMWQRGIQKIPTRKLKVEVQWGFFSDEDEEETAWVYLPGEIIEKVVEKVEAPVEVKEEEKVEEEVEEEEEEEEEEE